MSFKAKGQESRLFKVKDTKIRSVEDEGEMKILSSLSRKCSAPEVAPTTALSRNYAPQLSLRRIIEKQHALMIEEKSKASSLVDEDQPELMAKNTLLRLQSSPFEDFNDE